MPRTLETILYALGGGLLVAILTGLILGREKMRKLPGGSLASGLTTGALVAPGRPLMMALGAICGVVGWAFARPLFRPKED